VSPNSITALGRVVRELESIFDRLVELERPKNPSHGDYTTNVALQMRPVASESAREFAERKLPEVLLVPGIDRAEVAGPGFINLWIAPSIYGEALTEILTAGEDYGGGSAAAPERVQVELVSANPTGPIVVSAARNGVYGDCVARLLAFAGHTVEREYYYNNAGTQMERFRESVEAARRGEEPPEGGYRGAYIAELATAPADAVPEMLRRIEDSLERFRIHIDSWALQSELETRLPEFLPRLETYEQAGALWLRSSAHGDEKDRVVIRSAERGGLPTYRAADIVYLADKLGRYDRAIYVLGADHHGTRNWYAAIARMLGYDPDRVEVLLYQFVHLVRGGETTKMSKRAGDVVTLDELIDEVGVDAARWHLVNRGHDQTIEIDVDLAAEKTRKNPVYYVQYAHARIASILRNAGESPSRSAEPPTEIATEERDLIKRLAAFPGLVAEATERRAPHALPNYAIQLADDFHRFYTVHKVLGSETEAFRLALITATKTVLARSLDLVGVEAPDRM